MEGTEGHTVEGRVDRVHGGVVEGWAWSPAEPEKRLVVRVWLDGHELGATAAELERPSLAAAGIGDGGHAFRFVLPATLAAPGHHALRVDAGTEPLAPATPFRISSSGETDPWAAARFTVEQPSAEADAIDAVDGRIDAVKDGLIQGWAWIPSAPHTRVQVEVELDYQPVGTVTADLARPSLAAAGIGDGSYGFRFPLPVEHAELGTRVLRVSADHVALAPATAFSSSATDGSAWQGVRFAVERDEDLSGMALVGLDGWLFDGRAAGAWSRRDERVASERRITALLDELSALEELTAPTGAKLLVVLCPTKEYVMRELLPPDVAAVLPGRPGERLLARALAHPALDPLDLLPALRAGAERHPVFSPTTPDMTDWGCYCAYRAIVKRIAMIVPGVSGPKALDNDRIELAAPHRPTAPLVVTSGVGALPVPPDRLGEPPLVPVITAAPDAPAPMPSPQNRHGFMIGWEQDDDGELARAMLLGEPDDAPIAAWAARHFSRTVLAADTDELTGEDPPDVVVRLVHELTLLHGTAATAAGQR